MIPQIHDDLRQAFWREPAKPGRAYGLAIEQKRVRGWAEGLDAVRQAAFKILHTERYGYAIYSWNYGVELSDLFGSAVSYAIPEIKRRITEALTWDDRVEGVDGFAFEVRRGSVHAAFTVRTIYGDLREEMEVDIHG